MKNTFFIILILLLSFNGYTQIPAGYYNGTENLSGDDLQEQLHSIIDNHTSVSYSSLWTHMQNTDKNSNNKVWDMYSDVPGGTPPYTFTFVSDQCGNYGQEGDCYNREHSWPQSWFNSNSPMQTDLFHLYPTDGYVNGQRGNYPFGETDNSTWTSLNGSEKGPCSYPGNSGIVFEPIDEYKGDFARTYFYMSTRYYNEDSGWQSNEMVDGAEIKQWAKNMLIEWHIDDPVSAKEIARNDAVYTIQHNRNPFIDHPGFAQIIFGVDYPEPNTNGTPADTVTQGNQYSFVLPFSDELGNDIYFEESNLPSWLTLISDSNNATFSGTPNQNDIGIHNVSILAYSLYSDSVDFSFSIEVLSLIGINSMSSGNSTISIYPNPADNYLYLNSNTNIKSLNVFSVDGRIIRKYDSLKSNKLDIQFLENGFYNILIEDELGRVTSLSFIKNL